jgi:SPP1 family predicted phage head-tail adaptor
VSPAPGRIRPFLNSYGLLDRTFGARDLPAAIGALRDLVTLRSVARASDTGGWQTDTATTVVADVPAEVRPVATSEAFQADAYRGLQQYEIRIRYRADVKAKWQVLWDGKTLEVLAMPENKDARKRFLWLVCGEIEA